MMLAPVRPVVDPWRVRARAGGSTGRGGARVERAASSAALHGSEHRQHDEHDHEPKPDHEGPTDHAPDGQQTPILHARCNLATVGRWRGLWKVDGVCAWPGRRWRDKRRRVRSRLAFVLDWPHHPSGLCYGALYLALRLAPQSQQVRASRVPVCYSNPVLAFRSHACPFQSRGVGDDSEAAWYRKVTTDRRDRGGCPGPLCWAWFIRGASGGVARGAGLALILGHRRAFWRGAGALTPPATMHGERANSAAPTRAARQAAEVAYRGP